MRSTTTPTAARRFGAILIIFGVMAGACTGSDTTDGTIRLRNRIVDEESPTTEGPAATEAPAAREVPSEVEMYATDDKGVAIRPAGDSPEYRAREGEPSDVTFQEYGEHRFVPTDEDNLSTFAIDVDTGAYTIMRRWVDEGLIPPPESVRPEEYVNFFDLGYAPPTRGTFAVHADGGPTPFLDHKDDYLLRIGIQGEEVTLRERPDVVLTFVIDVSGSMNEGDRLEIVKDALAILVEQLGRDDVVSIVAYDRNAEVILDPTPADEQRAILRAIDRLEAGGSTNAEAGLVLGYDMADEAFDRRAVNKVILLSDGVANVGETGPDGIYERIARSADGGIDLLTVGVGLGNYNDVLLEQLADQANGHYRYIDTLDEAERVFSDDIVGTLITIARDMKVQVEFDPDVVTWYRLIGFENRDVADEDFRDNRVDGGEVGAGHSVTALYELELAKGIRGRATIGEVRIRWEDPASGDVHESVGEITLGMLEDSWDETDPHFRLAATVAAFADALRESRYARGYDLWDVYDEVDHFADELDDLDVWELRSLVRDLARSTSREG